MTDADARLLADALGLPVERVGAVVALLKAATATAETIEPAVYTVDDVLARVPWGRTTVDKMVKRRQIPMVYTEGRWIITPAAFRAAAERGFAVPAGRVGTRTARDRKAA